MIESPSTLFTQIAVRLHRRNRDWNSHVVISLMFYRKDYSDFKNLLFITVDLDQTPTHRDPIVW